MHRQDCTKVPSACAGQHVDFSNGQVNFVLTNTSVEVCSFLINFFSLLFITSVDNKKTPEKSRDKGKDKGNTIN